MIANWVVAYAVDFQSGLLSGAALGSMVRPDASGRLLWSRPGTRRILLASALGSVQPNVAQMGLLERSWLHTAQFLVTRSQGTRRFKSRGAKPKVRGWLCGTGNGQVDFILTLDGADFPLCFAWILTTIFRWTEEFWQLHFAVESV